MTKHICPCLQDVAVRESQGRVAERDSHAGDTGRATTTGLEVAAVTTGTVAAIKLLSMHCAPAIQWLVIPGVLIAAALVPTWIRRRELPNLGLGADRIRPAFRTAGCVCICVLPMVLLGLWLLTSLGLPIPLRPVLGGQQSPLTWLLYQLLYVAVAEEVFFRGYVQARTARLVNQARPLSRTTRQCVVIVVSAACFALAHVVIQGQITSALVFLPGLIMAWLYVRTRSLWAPILFHGLANASYGIMALVLK
jgi:membrane protease YdiL (CAAX protease family)